jgi:MFS family permease
MGIVLAAEAAPRVASLLLGGALADRLSPRLIMLVADIGPAGVVIALGVTLFQGLPALPIVTALAALQGVGSGLFLPGSQAIVPWTVSEDDVPAAYGLLQLSLWISFGVIDEKEIEVR